MIHIRVVIVLLSIYVLGATFVPSAKADEVDDYVFAETRNAVILVREAVALISERGEAAFEAFSVKGSRWFNGDTYLFIHDKDSRLVLNPAFPSTVGRNTRDFRDVSGKPVVDFLTDLAREGGGWLHYLWPRPGHVEPEWKSTYAEGVRSLDGTWYIVASGVYNAPMERCFVVQQVNRASAYLQAHGERGFAHIRSRSGPFVWRDSYVYVIGRDGIEYVNPAHPSLEGQNVSDRTDARGTLLTKMILEVPPESEGAWVEYWWPKPGQLKPFRKKAYIKPARINGKEYIVGSGMYSE